MAAETDLACREILDASASPMDCSRRLVNDPSPPCGLASVSTGMCLSTWWGDSHEMGDDGDEVPTQDARMVVAGMMRTVEKILRMKDRRYIANVSEDDTSAFECTLYTILGPSIPTPLAWILRESCDDYFQHLALTIAPAPVRSDDLYSFWHPLSSRSASLNLLICTMHTLTDSLGDFNAWQQETRDMYTIFATAAAYYHPGMHADLIIMRRADATIHEGTSILAEAATRGVFPAAPPTPRDRGAACDEGSRAFGEPQRLHLLARTCRIAAERTRPAAVTAIYEVCETLYESDAAAHHSVARLTKEKYDDLYPCDRDNQDFSRFEYQSLGPIENMQRMASRRRLRVV
jgi:hypothetical protein